MKQSNLEFATGADWYAVDANDNIAVFDSGFGPVPSILLSIDYESVNQSIHAGLLNLPIRCSMMSKFPCGGHSSSIDFAVRGIVSYCWADLYGPYLMENFPDQLVQLSEIPSDIADLLGTIRLQNLNFIDSESITADQISRSIVS